MEYIRAFLSNKILLISIVAFFSAQLIKCLICIFRKEKISWDIIFSSGGMPSSHSSTVCALCLSSGIEYGYGSIYFAITFILAFIVMYDAAGVRREAGEHARIINMIIIDLKNKETEKFWDKDLKELIGHTPTQVATGATLGVIIALLLSLI